MSYEKKTEQISLSLTETQKEFLSTQARVMSDAIHIEFGEQDVVRWMIDEFKDITHERWAEWGG